MQTRAFIPSLVCSMILLSGCVVVPVPQEPELLEGRAPNYDSFKPNVTTKQDVVNRCGPPSAIWVEANLYVYNWTMLEGHLLWAVVGYFEAGGGVEDISKRYMLLIQFNEHNLVKRVEKVSWPWYQSYGEVLRDWARNSAANSAPESTGRRE